MAEISTTASLNQRLASRVPAAMLTARFWFVAYLGWFVLLFILSSIPGTDTPRFPTHTDKVVHFLYFSGGGFALASAFSLRARPLRIVLLFTVVLAAGALVGFFDEWHQTFTAFRSGLDLDDWIADMLGTGAGIFAALWALRWMRAANGAGLPTSS